MYSKNTYQHMSDIETHTHVNQRMTNDNVLIDYLHSDI